MNSSAANNLAGLFYASAQRDPGHLALAWDGADHSYAELRVLVESIRLGLADDRAERIGILAARSPVAYAAVQAVLAEGKAYVPLNPIFPPKRNAFILEKGGIDTLIVGEECAPALRALLGETERKIRIVALPQAGMVQSLVAAHPDRISWRPTAVLSPDTLPRPLTPVTADADAYVLFTSGSTGEPKGVRVKHANVFSYVHSFLVCYPIFPTDRHSQTFDITFDVSVHDQFVTWAAGATLVSFPERSLLSPLAFAAEKKVTVWFSVPALAAFLESARQVVPGALPRVRLSLFAGEKLTWQTCEVWKTVAPNSRIANLYGPTEATIAITHFEMPVSYAEAQTYQGGIPIGRAFPGQVTEIRREDGSLCARGEIGSLWLSGDQLAVGYLGDAVKTEERFIVRPGDGVRWYRTGDLVLEDVDGEIQYVGREDFQVKVMGYRIELGEIEHALMKTSGAPFAIADVAALRDGMDEIYCVLPANCSARKKEIKSALKAHLPSYMMPRHLYFSDRIPLNSNGKMDRRALKDLIVSGALEK